MSTHSQRVIYTVSRLNQDVSGTLEQQFGLLWVEGELSNFSRPGSGHFYFSLKDSKAQLRCVMFRGRNRYVDFKPQDGQHVRLRGKLGIYAARGDFQFNVEHMELAGAGALQQQFELTKARLQAAGWFDAEPKKKPPLWPRAVGIITSPTGAAVRDIIHVLKRRFPAIGVIIYPTQVQGRAAAPQICRTIARANRRREVDTLIVARGGGSLEDLWAFNEKSVASAIYSSQLPVISGVGHEVDVTIADLVADLRAPTPSAAAELAVPDQASVLLLVRRLRANLLRALQHRLQPRQSTLLQLRKRLRLRHPDRVIAQQSQQLDELEARMIRAWTAVLGKCEAKLQYLHNRLQLESVALRIERQMDRTDTARLKLRISMMKRLDRCRTALASSSRALEAVSPLATLSRGYAVVRYSGSVVTDSQQVEVGDSLETLLAHGSLRTKVTRKLP